MCSGKTPFLRVNCGAIPQFFLLPNAMESFFGLEMPFLAPHRVTEWALHMLIMRQNSSKLLALCEGNNKCIV